MEVFQILTVFAAVVVGPLVWVSLDAYEDARLAEDRLRRRTNSPFIGELKDE